VPDEAGFLARVPRFAVAIALSSNHVLLTRSHLHRPQSQWVQSGLATLCSARAQVVVRGQLYFGRSAFEHFRRWYSLSEKETDNHSPSRRLNWGYPIAPPARRPSGRISVNALETPTTKMPRRNVHLAAQRSAEQYSVDHAKLCSARLTDCLYVFLLLQLCAYSPITLIKAFCSKGCTTDVSQLIERDKLV
jgi:hypothetical protein